MLEHDKIRFMNTDRNILPIAEFGVGAFESEVLKAEQPVLVFFQASWSRPCQVMASVLCEMAADTRGVKICKINADDNPGLSLLYEVQSIPTLLFFVNGTLRASIVGTTSKDAILAKLQSLAPLKDTWKQIEEP
jgi:thioredoxin 1